MIGKLKLAVAGGLLVGLVLSVLWYGHSRYVAGEAACNERWESARDAAEADAARREAAIRARAVSLATQLQDAQIDATRYRQELEHARSRGTLVQKVEVPCPDLSPDFIRLWNAAAGGTASSSPGSGPSSDPVPGSEADPAR